METIMEIVTTDNTPITNTTTRKLNYIIDMAARNPLTFMIVSKRNSQ